RPHADPHRQPGTRIDPGGRTPRHRRLALLRPQAGQGAPFLYRQRAGVHQLQERARIRVIGGSTRLVALLGQPVAGSLSPRMQNAAFAARALDWAYLACEVAPEGLAAAVGGLVALGFGGANVTGPPKEAAAEPSAEAEGPA